MHVHLKASDWLIERGFVSLEKCCVGYEHRVLSGVRLLIGFLLVLGID
jgi:hypothetical protein